MKRHTAIKVHTSLDHHIVITALGTGVVANDPGQHRQNTTKAQGVEEPEGPGLLLGHMITYRQSEYLEDQRKQQCKVYNSTSSAQLGHG
jgi:hypothetical protein